MKLDLDAYIEFVARHQDLLSDYVSLDLIPTERTADALRASARESYRNLVRMRRAGLRPLPVVHAGEDLRWLKQLLDDGHDYVGVAVPGTIETQRAWLDRVFSLLNGSGVKVHGFGLTDPALLLTFPFHSVDSTTWALSAGYGRILVPQRGEDGTFDYSRPPEGFIMSGQRQSSDGRNARRFELLRDAGTRDRVAQYLASFGVSTFEARHAPGARRCAMLLYYMALAERLGVTVYFATRLDAGFAELLTRYGAATRLLSYAELKDRPDAVLRRYVETGLVPRKQVRPPKVDWDATAYRSRRALGLGRRLKLIPEASEKAW